jgi:hypothetical protein
MLLEAKLSPMNLGDQRFAIEIAESEETRIQRRLSDGMRRPVSAGCIKLPRIDALVAQRKGDRLEKD